MLSDFLWTDTKGIDLEVTRKGSGDIDVSEIFKRLADYVVINDRRLEVKSEELQKTPLTRKRASVKQAPTAEGKIITLKHVPTGTYIKLFSRWDSQTYNDVRE